MHTPLLECRDISFQYEAQRGVLSGVSFVVEENDRIGLMGRNGSGKTTLLHLLVGLLRPDRGTLYVFGQECSQEADFQRIRTRVGLLFQDPEDQLFCPTVADDIAFGPLNQGYTATEALAISREVLAELGMSDYENRVTYRLSGGEKRMISLAAVLAMKPDVLLLDEPTSGIDFETEQRLVNVLNELPQSMIIVSHEKSFLEAVTTRSLSLVNGSLKEV
jgi:cobalt/nickel transport system ATP-binding protein